MMRRVVGVEDFGVINTPKSGGSVKRLYDPRAVGEEIGEGRGNDSKFSPLLVPNFFCITLVLAILMTFMANTSQAQSQCGCDFIISTSATEYLFDGQQKGVKPGDVICFASGTRRGITLSNIQGTPQQPVVIKNMCDGKVTIDAPTNMGNSLEVANCKYIHLTGSGNPNEEYGIEVRGAVMGVNFHFLSSDIEADHLNVNNTGCVGIVAKTDPTCDPATWRENFVMENLYFHHNLLDHTGCEGFYIGNSHYSSGVTKTCNGQNIQIMEHDMYNVEIAYNKLTNIGNDGIQFSAVLEGMVVHHNTVYNFGTNNNDQHENGIQSGAATHSVVYNNIVDTGTGYGVFEGGRGNAKYYNNIIMNCNIGMLITDNVPYIPAGNIITNNIILNAKETALYLYTTHTNQNLFLNNIVVTNQPNYTYIKFNSSNIKFTDQGNIKTNDINSLKFVNASGKDFHLQSGSPARNAGLDLSSYGISGQNFDLDDKSRPLGGKYDIGPYEYQEGQAPETLTVNAGSDILVAWPLNSAQVKGTATITNGTVKTIAWTKVSGGSVTLGNANTYNLNLTNLQQGAYTFRLTVTSNSGLTSSDDVLVNVLIPPPSEVVTADAGKDVQLTLPSNSTTLTGTGSSTTGTIISNTWTQTAGGTVTMSGANTNKLAVTFPKEGTYSFKYTVVSSGGKSASDDVNVIVNPATMLKAQFNFTNSSQNISGWNDLVGHPHEKVITVSDATTGITVSSVATNQWNPVNYGSPTSCYNGGVTNGTVQPSSVVKTNWFCYNAAYGDKVNGIVQKDNIKISKLNPSHKYRLLMGASRITGGASDQYGSYEFRINGLDPKVLLVTNNTNQQVEYIDIIPDGAGNIGLSARKVNGSSMNFGYIGWLVVEDLGSSNTNRPANQMPTAQAGTDVYLSLPENSTTLKGQATDTDGTIASIQWTKVSGPNVTIANASSLSLSLSNLVDGTYEFKLTVTDNDGGQGEDDVKVIVDMATGAKFNFSNTNQSINGWTTLYGSPHAQFIEAIDGNSKIRINNVAANQWNPVNYGSLLSSYNGGVSNGTVQPAEVINTNWFNYNAAYGSTVNGISQGDNIQLLDLKPNQLYQINIGASRASGGATDQYGVMEYRFNGINAQPLLVTNNASTEVVVQVTSDAKGRIGISARKVSGGSLNFGYIGWLVIEEASKANTTARVAGEELAAEQYEAMEVEWVHPRPYPNPASSTFSLDLSGYGNQPVEIAIVALSGTIVRMENAEGGDVKTFSVDDLIPGMYVVRILSNKPMVTEKLIVRR